MLNSYKYSHKQRKINAKNAWAFLLLLLVIMGVSIYRDSQPPRKLISPISTKVYAEGKPTPTPTPYSVEEDIKQVFGKYYPKAMLLLKGDETKGSCHENYTLNPKAVNDNTQWGGIGRDWGVFQINDVWQDIGNVNFLIDPKINIRIAWNIFERSGYSFKMWSCGQYYKI